MSLNLRNLHNGRENVYTFVCGDNNDPCRWGKSEFLNGRDVRELPVTRWEFEVVGREEIRVRLRKDRGGVLYWKFSQLPREFVRPYRWPDSFRVPTYNLEVLVNNVCEEVDKKRHLAATTATVMWCIKEADEGSFVLAKLGGFLAGTQDGYEAVYPLACHEEAADGMYTVYKDGRKFHADLYKREGKWCRQYYTYGAEYEELKHQGLPVKDWEEKPSSVAETVSDQPFPHPEWGTSPADFYSRSENRFED